MNKPLPYAKIERDFDKAVNMTADQIEAFLGTKESKAVGFTYPGERDSVGRQSARKIVRILEHGPQDERDWLHMRKVVGYVKRHTAQRGKLKRDIATSRWRYSLMNWGHDPLEIGELEDGS